MSSTRWRRSKTSRAVTPSKSEAGPGREGHRPRPRFTTFNPISPAPAGGSTYLAYASCNTPLFCDEPKLLGGGGMALVWSCASWFSAVGFWVHVWRAPVYFSLFYPPSTQTYSSFFTRL